MIYLQKEHEQFEDTKRRFEAAFVTTLERMLNTYRAKGESRDVDSPIHHRMSPGLMLGLLQAKSRRLDSIMSRPGWEQEPSNLEKLIEESGDVATYASYISALCLMLLKENQPKKEVK